MAVTGIWKKAFSTKKKLDGVDVVGNKRTKLAFCSLNKTGVATISYPVTGAILAFVQGRVSVGLVPRDQKGMDMLFECKSQHIIGRKYVIKYNAGDKKLTAFAANNDLHEPFDFVMDQFAHWSLFIPRVAELLINQNPEFKDNFEEVKKLYKQQGYIPDCDELFVLNDYLYLTRDDYEMPDKDISVLDKTEIHDLIQDLTDKVGGTVGEFNFTKQGQKAKTKAKNTVTKPKNTKFKTGIFGLDFNPPLSKEHEALIPSYDFGMYQVAPDIEELAFMIQQEIDTQYPIRNLILYGEAGAGKSTGSKIISQLLGLPYRFTNLSLNSEESDIIGSFMPQEDGTFKYKMSPFALAYKFGGVIELMEANFARPGALGALNSALDDTSKLILGNGEIVERHPNCIIIITTNVDYAGCQKLNESLKDRFQQMRLIQKLGDKELVELVMAHSGNSDNALVAKMVDAMKMIAIKIVDESITGGVCSTRQLINWAKACKYAKNPIEAAKVTILPGVSLDPDVHEDILTTILRNMF